VTAGGRTHTLAPPFFVLATQNPIEQEGTYPLPEAQLDRFMFKMVVPFPNQAEMNEIVLRTILKPHVSVDKILDSEKILTLRAILAKVVVAPPMLDYAIRLVLATHPDSEFASEDVKRFVKWGASPRASQALIMAARANALASGRAHISYDDIKEFASEVLQHRIILNYDGQAEGKRSCDIVASLIGSVKD